MQLEPILSVKNLVTAFDTRQGTFKAVDDVSLDLLPGRTLCLVGESGSGKTVLSRSILQLVDRPGRIVSGDIFLRDVTDGAPQGEMINLARLRQDGPVLRRIRGGAIGTIFQEPMSSLSPVHKIGDQIAESLIIHEGVDRRTARARVIDMLKQVEIPRPERAYDQYTFEFSGGMRQRAMIAMALICHPRIVIADEPTTALDVTIQAEILDLLNSLKQSHGMSILFITHDMGVVAEIADDVAVMRYGKLVESGPVAQIFENPQHAYTRKLLAAAQATQMPSERRLAIRAARPIGETILTARALRKEYTLSSGLLGQTQDVLVAVDDADLQIREGETVGVVGESGSGKTTLARCLQRIHSVNGGEILFRHRGGEVQDISSLGDRQLRDYWRDVRMVFQDPFASLNPRMTVAQIIGESLLMFGEHDGRKRRDRIAELLDLVGLPSSAMERFPHAFSGGQRQRIGIARALAPNPRIVIADEATSSLDVSIRMQILDLLLDLQEKLNLSYLFISHDVGLVRFFCDRVLVMYKGKVVEAGETEAVCTTPQHAYTKALLSAVPITHPSERGSRHRSRYLETTI